LNDIKPRGQTAALYGADQAQLGKLACLHAPEDAAGWTLNLLTDKLVELRIVNAVSRETARRTHKKSLQTVAVRSGVHPTGA